ncbi:hypothetical protein ACIG0D_01875 [Streptomyces sp. NPDC052773]|uniref:hypothetical protein n=1 Tax=Streptomyces sp. NPDC052773 TaxID=3365693 RepID=UPI0037D6F885
MPTGPEHYREAERLLKGCQNSCGALVIEDGTAEVLAAAQVHATLALAAATAMGAPVDGEGDSGLPPRDAKAWFDVAGVKLSKGGTA